LGCPRHHSEDSLTNDEFIPHLVNLLLYLVLTAEVFALDLFNGLTVSVANGEPLLITLPPIAGNSNKVVSADNDVSNGVVHILELVLIPTWVTSSITDRVVGASDLSTLKSLVVLAELGDALAGAGELTLVAPTNDAFAKLSAATVVLLTSEEGKDTLINILLYQSCQSAKDIMLQDAAVAFDWMQHSSRSTKQYEDIDPLAERVIMLLVVFTKRPESVEASVRHAPV
jgi:uncharacterized surface protein with fasciclin (FAS1) repeats